MTLVLLCGFSVITNTSSDTVFSCGLYFIFRLLYMGRVRHIYRCKYYFTWTRVLDAEIEHTYIR